MTPEEFIESQKNLNQVWTISSKPVPSKRIGHYEPKSKKVWHYGPKKTPVVYSFGRGR